MDIPSDSGRSTETEGSVNPAPVEEPVAFYHNMPVYSARVEAVNTEEVIQNVVTCPDSCVTQERPSLVTENFCFVVDGEKVKLSDVLNEAKAFWKPTGHPTKYYFSEDLKTFHKVQVTTIRGKLMSARMQKDASTKVSLEKVFKVSRYYSFWKTCPQFHRIITVISPMNDSQLWNFKNRIFVQYLWRDARDEDKRRVAKEWNPQGSKIWQYATSDPQNRRRTFNF